MVCGNFFLILFFFFFLPLLQSNVKAQPSHICAQINLFHAHPGTVMALNTLDYEERQQYILKIRAYDIQSSESSEVNLNITILVSILLWRLLLYKSCFNRMCITIVNHVVSTLTPSLLHSHSYTPFSISVTLFRTPTIRTSIMDSAHNTP